VAARTTGPILLRFPIYGGGMGIMAQTRLAGLIAKCSSQLQPAIPSLPPLPMAGRCSCSQDDPTPATATMHAGRLDGRRDDCRGIAAFPATWNVTHAAPPPNADPQRHLWFERQRRVTGIWCCNTADGHVLDDDDWRATSEHYEVRLAGTWFVVPAHALRDPRGGPNMIGRAVVWYVIMEAGVQIMCFAPGWSG
jgi:hypothetical protein